MEQANAAIPQVRKKKTKQKHHPGLAVLLLIICLTAGFTVYKTYTSHEEKWQTAYSEFLPLFAEEPEKYIVQGEGFDAGTYQMCDVNGDGIPELFINILRDENHYFGTSESVNLTQLNKNSPILCRWRDELQKTFPKRNRTLVR